MQARPASEFAEVLAGALSLPAEDRLRLCSVLERLAPVSPSSALPAACVHTADPGESSQATLEEWLAQVTRAPAWSQLLLLDDALESVDSDSQASALQAARTRLLQANPAIAVRHAVVALASRHPIGVCLGALGLTVAVFGLARILLRIVF